MSHLQPGFSAPSTKLRAQGYGVKPLGNKGNIFWEAPGLDVPRRMCELKRYLPLPGGMGKDCLLWPWSTNRQRSGSANPCTSTSTCYFCSQVVPTQF